MTQIYTRPFTSSRNERSSSYEQRLAMDPYAPRELSASDKTSLNLDGKYRGTGWEPSPSENHKIACEEPPTNVEVMYRAKSDNTQKSPREQLPPLSSLFGSSSSLQSRPGQSPFSDRQSPLFPGESSLDTRHSVTPIHLDRAYDGPYFQRPSTSRHYSFGSSRSEQGDRQSFQPPPRPSQAAESPRFESQFGAPTTSRTQLPNSASVNAWSSQSYTPRLEYFYRDTSSSFRPRSEHRPPPPPIHRTDQDSRAAHRNAHTPPTPAYPPTPASTVAGDGGTVKDALGPKIWTGTQFLPRFLRQSEVPGEGMCYFYDDGTHCKTVIDGEIVNAHWGVTKAGKPRKRLAIACITCREKKIKCDPDYPQCVQCEKFGRVCKFKNAPRGGQGSPDTPPADLEDFMRRPGSSRTDGESSFKVEKREESHSVSPRQTLRHVTPDSEAHAPKRQRTGYSDFTPVASESSPRPSALEATAPSTPWIEPIVASPISHNLLHQWQMNPYTSNESLVAELLSIFFKDVPETVHCMFPEGPFKSWVLSSKEKSLDDLMLTYTILALGAVFSHNAEHKALGIQYAAISRYACDNRHFSIQLVQSRLILSVYYFAINNINDSWDFCGAALRAASRIQLHLEMEKSEEALLKAIPYGLNRAGYAECRRRTFWVCYLLDRFNGFGSGHLSSISSEDVFLRLPSGANSFEQQLDLQNPFFDISTPPLQNINRTIGSLGYLIQIITIWGDVMANTYRSSQRPAGSTSSAAFRAFYDKTTQRLHQWRASLPARYQFSVENLNATADSGKLGMYMTMHLIYLNTAMKLNRYIQKSTLSVFEIESYTNIASHHAEDVLLMMDVTAKNTSHRSVKLASLFAGYSIVCAVDILTAKMKLENIPTRLASLSGVQSALAELAQYWQTAKNQQATIQQRVSELTALRNGRGNLSFVKSDPGEAGVEFRERMENIFDRNYDCFYT